MQASNNPYLLPAAVVVAGVILSLGVYFKPASEKPAEKSPGNTHVSSQLDNEKVFPSGGVLLPVVWGDMGKRLVEAGAIDEGKFRALYESQNGYTQELDQMLRGRNDEKLKITRENSGYVLNLLWALGLANKNEILEAGEMADKKYGGPHKFASTGGWTVAVGDPMNHYSRHSLVVLSEEEQQMVERVAKGVYRPCCGNSTHFPDCNHGMAMLGLLELMASQGATEDEMWDAALAVNSYWFPSMYATLALYMEGKGVEWSNVDPKEILGFNYSSSYGYARIATQFRNQSGTGSGGCGVSAAPATQVVQQQKQGGCGI